MLTPTPLCTTADGVLHAAQCSVQNSHHHRCVQTVIDADTHPPSSRAGKRSSRSHRLPTHPMSHTQLEFVSGLTTAPHAPLRLQSSAVPHFHGPGGMYGGTGGAGGGGGHPGAPESNIGNTGTAIDRVSELLSCANAELQGWARSGVQGHKTAGGHGAGWDWGAVGAHLRAMMGGFLTRVPTRAFRLVSTSLP